MTQLHFPADSVLRIAENNGGQTKRSSVKDVCEITLLLSPDSAGYKGWDVRYSDKGNGKIFQIQVDPTTGNINHP
jgi:hypothetical protein